jgi:hypothetical protein
MSSEGEMKPDCIHWMDPTSVDGVVIGQQTPSRLHQLVLIVFKSKSCHEQINWVVCVLCNEVWRDNSPMSCASGFCRSQFSSTLCSLSLLLGGTQEVIFECKYHFFTNKNIYRCKIFKYFLIKDFIFSKIWTQNSFKMVEYNNNHHHNS